MIKEGDGERGSKREREREREGDIREALRVQGNVMTREAG